MGARRTRRGALLLGGGNAHRSQMSSTCGRAWLVHAGGSRRRHGWEPHRSRRRVFGAFPQKVGVYVPLTVRCIIASFALSSRSAHVPVRARRIATSHCFGIVSRFLWMCCFNGRRLQERCRALTSCAADYGVPFSTNSLEMVHTGSNAVRVTLHSGGLLADRSRMKFLGGVVHKRRSTCAAVSNSEQSPTGGVHSLCCRASRWPTDCAARMPPKGPRSCTGPGDGPSPRILGDVALWSWRSGFAP